MTKNNEYILPKQNPFATVYELKNEVPSFEEFMKGYENDGNVNYDDLNGGDVGEVKGYGPCGWDNPDCECYIGEGRYVPLYLVCPAPKDRYPWCTDKTPGQFTHGGGCGGRRYINTDLMVKCMKCGSSNYVTKSVFRCSTHKDDQYIGASKSEFSKAITLLNNLSKNKGEVTRMYISKMVKKALEEDGFEY